MFDSCRKEANPRIWDLLKERGDGEGQDCNSKDRQFDEQASDLLKEKEWAAEEG